MKATRAFFRRLAGLFGQGRRDRELTAEIESHLELAVEDGVRAGLDPSEARRQAVLRLGGVEPVKEAYRDRRGLPFMESTLQDLRYAARSLARNPSFTVVAVATLGVGIGASTTMFGVADAVLLRPLPYPEPSRLVQITETNPLKRWTQETAAPANFLDWRRSNRVFADMAGYVKTDVFLTGQGEPQRLRAVASTGNLFDVIGMGPKRGRAFTYDETFEGKSQVRDGLRPVLLGIALGLPLAYAGASLIRSFLFGVVPADPATYAITLATLGTVALGACALPAARALRVDPLVCLRDE